MNSPSDSAADGARKPRIAIVFGGRSSEHSISCISAGSVIAAIDPEKYDVVPVGIATDGRWVLESSEPGHFALGSGGELPSVTSDREVALTPGQGLVVTKPGDVPDVLGEVDVVFPVMHGPWGQDGTLQGLLEMADVRYVGAGVLSSAVGTDKHFMKQLFLAAGLPVLPYVLVRSREWLEKGIRAVEELDASTSRAVFVADPGVMMMGLVATELVHLGLVEQGRQRIEAARARALTLREPAPRQAAFWLAALFEVRVGNPERAAEAAERLAQLQEEYDGPEGKAAALWFRGWAEAHLGEPRTGHRLIREGYERVARCGMRAYAGETLGYAAEALMLAGDWAAARKQIAEAMQCAEATGDRSCRPRLLMFEARIADALGEHRGARDALLGAVAEARTQEAPWLELLALLALCERGDATVEELAALREVVEGLTEGLDMPAVVRARDLVSRRRAPALA